MAYYIVLFYFLYYIILYYIMTQYFIVYLILLWEFFFVFQPGFVAFVGVWLLWLYQYLSIYLSNLT